MDRPDPLGGSLEDLRALTRDLHPDEIVDLVAGLPIGVVESLTAGSKDPMLIPRTPIEQARAIDEGYRVRPHLQYLSDQIAEAVADVEKGINRRLIVELPPRSGKTTMTTLYTPAWIMHNHPDWPIALVSHDGTLATSWGRQIRRWAEGGLLGVGIARDAGAASEWETTEGGTMLARSYRESFTGRGARVLIVDDIIKDFVEAHSQTVRDSVWNWWLTVALGRLEPPYLVIVTATRWHEDDFIGRLLSPEYEGDPAAWQEIRLAALATGEDDPLGRSAGEALLSPLLDETPDEARARYEEQREAVGSYTFAAMYQQRPAPAKGAIFDSGWWRFWSWDPDKATEDGRVIHLDPSSLAAGGKWLDSWDLSFDSGEKADWVVGQRWCRRGPDRFLLASKRGRWNFTETIREMKAWAGVEPDDWNEDELGPFDPYDLHRNPWGQHVHLRVIEKKANGAAAINVLSETISGLKPVSPTASKEIRARAVTPEIESGHVYLPHPSDPGNEWVTDLLSELRNFPHDAHDDQVDTLTQALGQLRNPGKGSVHSPVKHGIPQRRPGLGQPGLPGLGQSGLGGKLRTPGFRR